MAVYRFDSMAWAAMNGVTNLVLSVANMHIYTFSLLVKAGRGESSAHNTLHKTYSLSVMLDFKSFHLTGNYIYSVVKIIMTQKLT